MSRIYFTNSPVIVKGFSILLVVILTSGSFASTNFLFSQGTKCADRVSSTNAFFSDRTSPFQIVISAPLRELFTRAFAGTKKSLVPESGRDFPYLPGEAIYDGQSYGITIKVRGQTSIAKASFPKLTLKWDAPPAEFIGHTKIKIGTHIGEHKGGSARYQKSRLHNELAPPREAFIYHLLNLLELPAQRSRVGLINWNDTSTDNPLSPVTRSAFFLEHIKSAAKRLNLKRGPKEINVDKEFVESIDRVHAAKLHLFNIMIGQWDFKLPLNYRNNPRKDRLHNIYTLIQADGVAVPLLHDFDLTALVTSKIYSHKDMARAEGISKMETVMLYEIAKLQHELTGEEYINSVQWIRSYQSKIFKSLETYTLDEHGQKFIHNYFTTFFNLLDQL